MCLHTVLLEKDEDRDRDEDRERVKTKVIIVKSGGDKHYGEWKKKQESRKNKCRWGLRDSIFYRHICILCFFFPFFERMH